jgi:hypothetical protein
MSWEQLSMMVGVLSPLVGVPLTVIALYLRAIREHQTATMAEITHRIQTIEAALHDMVKCTADFEREYTTWKSGLREPCSPGIGSTANRDPDSVQAELEIGRDSRH